MKKILAIFVCLTGILFYSQRVLAQTGGDAILGRWQNEDKSRIMEFVKNGNTYEAVIIEAPDKSLVGKLQITGLVYDGGYTDGMVHLPKRGKVLPCTVKIIGNNKLELAAKAGFMSKTQTWSRL